MRLAHYSPPRPGHSLIEMMAALISSAILLAGLGTVMFIARQVAYTPTASAERLNSAQAAHQFADDVRFATLIVARSTRMLEFLVVDRDSDGDAERIRYEWSGIVGDPLVKTFNGGTPFDLIDSVDNFNCAVNLESKTTTVSTTTDTAEAVLVSNTNVQGSADRQINSLAHSAQRLNPSAFTASAPGTATYWNATRVDLYGRQSSSATQNLRVQIRKSGEPYDSPVGAMRTEMVVPEANLTGSAGWNSVTFTSPARELSLHRTYALVLQGTTGESGDAMRLTVNDTAASGVNESGDGGATWTYNSARQIYYRLYGTYTSPGSSYNVVRNYATRVNFVLQTADTSQSRVDASVPLVNAPELLSAYWRTDFDTNPTTTDVMGDGAADWAFIGSGSFNVATMIDGVWHTNGALETRPLNAFTNITTVDVRCRNTAVGGNGAVTQINVDRQSGLHAPLIVRLQLQSDGSQTLSLLGKSSDANTTTLFQRTSLSNGFIRFRLTVLPANNLVNLQIDDEDQGTFTYPTYAPAVDNRYLSISEDTTNAEFDYVEIRVSESS